MGTYARGRDFFQRHAQYQLDGESLSKLEGHADLMAASANDIKPISIETEGDQKLVERHGKLYSGNALNYGVVFAPTCLSPLHSRFVRVLP